MIEHPPRPVAQIVDDQLRRWQLKARTVASAPPRPVIAMSRQHGAGGSQLARRLVEDLGLDFFDREIIHEIARSAQLSEQIVSQLDEKDREPLADWLSPFVKDSYLSTSAYREHLTHVVRVIASHGGAVILGRGAHLILGPARALRVMVIAPLEARVAEVARREGLSEAQARHRIQDVEAERRAFLARHFHTGFADLATFDLVVNTAALGIEGGARTVQSALAALPSREEAPAPVRA